MSASRSKSERWRAAVRLVLAAYNATLALVRPLWVYSGLNQHVEAAVVPVCERDHCDQLFCSANHGTRRQTGMTHANESVQFIECVQI